VGPKGDYIGHYACQPVDTEYISAGTLPGEDGSELCRPTGSTRVDGCPHDPELLQAVRQDLIDLLRVRSSHPGTPVALVDNVLKWYQTSTGISQEYAAVLREYAPTYNKAMSFIAEESGEVGCS
jgi:hypothetical protein